MNREEAASLLGWWLDAGVDLAIAEEPRLWLKSPEPARDLHIAEAPSAAAPVDRPETLEAFHSWLRETSDLPLFKAGSARALPHGRRVDLSR